MKLLEMRSIRKAFRVGVTVLDDLSLSVEEGEVLALIGSSGLREIDCPAVCRTA